MSRHAARIAAAGRHGDVPEALRILRAVPPSQYTYSAAIAACTKAKQWQRGLALFEEVKLQRQWPETVVINTAIGAVAAGGHWPHALALLAGMSTPDIASFTAAMVACSRAGQWTEGLMIWQRMVATKVRCDLPAVLAAIQLHGGAGDWDGAVAVLRCIFGGAGQVVPVEAYNACITACGRSHATEAAAQLLNEMKRQVAVPTQVSFGAALRALAPSGAWEWALGILSDMESHGWPPDAAAFAAAIGCCSRARQWRAALDLLARASGIDGEEHVWNAAIAVCGRVGRWLEALLLLDSLGCRRTTASWNAAITACAEAAEWALALGLVRRMQTSGASTSGKGVTLDVITFNATITACRNDGRWREALQVLEEMHDAGVKPNTSTLTVAVGACEQGGAARTALHLWTHFVRAGVELTGPAYNAALVAAARGNLWAYALDLLREMVDRSVPRTRRSCQALLRACEPAQRFREAAGALGLFHNQLDSHYLDHISDRLERRLLGVVQTFKRGSVADVVGCGPKLALQSTMPLVLTRDLPRPTATPVDLGPLAAAVTAALPGATLWPLGSAVEGLRATGSDVDTTVILPAGPLDGETRPENDERELRHFILRRLRPLLASRACGLEVLDLLLVPRMPILRLCLPCGTRSDLSVENRLGCRKSSLVAAHLATCPALRHVCFLLKVWARRRGVYGQTIGYPSGLAFACLGIFFGQCLEPPIARTLDPAAVPPCAQWDEIPPGASQGQPPDLVPRLIVSAFAFYADDFDWEYEVVSIRRGQRSHRVPSPGCVLSIEDPVQPELDLAAPYMDAARSAALRAEFRCGWELLLAGGWKELFGTAG